MELETSRIEMPKKDAIQKLVRDLPKIKGRKFIVIGDSGLDEYVFGKVRRISPEAPVPVVEVNEEKSTDFRLGLSTNVAQNIVSLGGEALLVSVIGSDPAAEHLKSLLTSSKISSNHLIVDKNRPTTRKLRVMSGQHHIVRIDYEHQKFLPLEVEQKLIAKVQDLISTCDGVVIQDYAKGVISENSVQKITGIAKKASKKVFVDPHRSTPIHYYRGSDIMTPNYDEAIALSGLRFDDLRQASDSLNEVGETIRKAVQSENLVITRGREGMSLFEGKKISQIPTFARQVFDVTGAGDTVIAALSAAWVSGFSLVDSCLIANYAAGVVVGKVGCVPCSFDELVQSMSVE